MKCLSIKNAVALCALMYMTLFIPMHSFAQMDTAIIDRSQPYVISASSDENMLGLEDEITVYVANWMNTCGHDRSLIKKLMLYINDQPVEGISPISFAVDTTTLGLKYFVTHEAGPIAAWDKLFMTRNKSEFFSRKVKISVGYQDQPPLQTKVKEKNGFTVLMVRKSWFYICLAVLVLFFILFVVIAVKSDLIRDHAPDPPKGKRKPFSLARTQMAIWFFIIVSSWLLLYVLKHTLDTIPQSMVVLMGIAAGTGVGATAIGKRKAALKYSGGFFKDIISDENGVSFYRFQMATWTVVMVMVFVRQVWSYLAMPEFDSSLLVLMGISSGTYLGFKANEKPKDEPKDKPDDKAAEEPVKQDG